MQPPLLHPPLHLLINRLGTLRRPHLLYLPLLLKVLDNGHARFLKDLEALLDALCVVVGAAGRFAAVEQALLHDGFGAVEEEGEEAGADGVFEAEGLVHFAGETCITAAVGMFTTTICGALGSTRMLGLTIYQESPFAIPFCISKHFRHCVLEQLHRHLHGHNASLLDVLFNHLPELTTFSFLLGS